MKKFFTKSFSALIAVFFFALSADAQVTFYEEQFDGGLNGWTTNIVQGVNDSMDWVWTAGGVVDGLIFANTQTIGSPSAANGAAMMNYEYFRTGGNPDNQPAQPYGDFIGELISPTIDLSDASGALEVRAYQVVRRLGAAQGSFFYSFSLSTDDGATWGDPVELNPNLVANGPILNDWVSGNIPLGSGVAGSSTVKLKFTYAGNFYFWALDDIMISERGGRDMRANTNFFAIAPNYATPVSQLDPFPFLVDLENVGGQPVSGVNLNMEVRNIGTGAVAYTVDQPYGTIAPDSIAENVPFGSFMPDADLASYRATYTVTADSMDTDPSNNTIDFEFTVTEGTFQKEAGENLTGIAAGDDNTWSMGNVYYVPNPGYVATNVTIGIANPEDIVGQSITVKLLRWEGDVNESFSADMEEYVLQTFNGHTFTGNEPPFFSIPVDIDGNAWPLEAGFHYIVLMEYRDVSNTTVFFTTTLDHDYGAMRLATDSLGASRYGTVLGVGAEEEYSVFNFSGGFYVPTIRMDIREPWAVGTKDLSEENIVSIFPNPTADQLNIDLDLLEQTEVLEVRVADVSGKVFIDQQYENVKKDRISFDLADYPAGTYTVQLTTGKGVRTLPFVVQH